jgi:hypothetical protein
VSPIITFMFEPAKLQMNWASASGAINRRALRSAAPEARPSAAEELTGAPSNPRSDRTPPIPHHPVSAAMPRGRGGTDPRKRHESRLLPSTRPTLAKRSEVRAAPRGGGSTALRTIADRKVGLTCCS